MAYGRKKKKTTKKEAAHDEGLVGCCFVIVGTDTKVAAEGDVQAKLRDDLYLVKFYGRDDKPPHMKAVPTDAFIMRPAQPLWLFFEDEDSMDEWIDEHEGENGATEGEQPEAA